MADDIAGIVDCIKIPGRRDPEASKINLLRDWLRRGDSGPWLLIVDNVDDVNTEIGSMVTKFLEGLPNDCSSGYAMITTRDERIAHRFAGNEIFPIEPMDDVEARDLLHRKLGHDHKALDDVAELAVALDRMPLALAQAAAYIKERKPRCSVRDYLELLRGNDANQDHPLLEDLDHQSFRRDASSTNAIYLTWRISFDTIQRLRSSAADLLSLMCFFDRQAIPEWALRPRSQGYGSEQATSNTGLKPHGSNRGRLHEALNTVQLLWQEAQSLPWKASVKIWALDSYRKVTDMDESQRMWNDAFEKDIVMLRNYRLVSVTTEAASMFEMHGLVQRATQWWLKADGKYHHWRSEFATRLDTRFPAERDHQYLARCKALMPHIKCSIPLEPPLLEDQTFALEWADLLYRAGRFAIFEGALEDGERMAELSHKLRRRFTDRHWFQWFTNNEDSTTLRSQALVMHALWRRGSYSEAIRLGESLLSVMERVLGRSHVWTLDAANDLALAYKYEGLLDEALDKHTENYKTSLAAYGEEDVTTLISKNNLGQVYAMLGQFTKAAEYHKAVFDARMKTSGEKHPLTMNAAHNLAIAYMKLYRIQEAEKLFRLSIDNKKKILGEEHVETLNSMGCLAGLLRDRNELEEAERLATGTLDIRKRVLGERHPDTLTDMSNLALILFDRGQSTSAHRLLLRCASLSEQILGAKHDKTVHRYRMLREVSGGEPSPSYRSNIASGNRPLRCDYALQPQSNIGYSGGIQYSNHGCDNIMFLSGPAPRSPKRTFSTIGD
jgi:tetratricopeptide (TPR) repeat protein